MSKLPDISKKNAKIGANKSKKESEVNLPSINKKNRGNSYASSNLTDSFLNSIMIKSKNKGKKNQKTRFMESSDDENLLNKNNRKVSKDVKGGSTDKNDKKNKKEKDGKKKSNKDLNTQVIVLQDTEGSDQDDQKKTSQSSLPKRRRFDRDKPRCLEIPHMSMMKFFGLLEETKWSQALKICKNFIALQPANQNLREFLILLRSLAKLKEEMGSYYKVAYKPLNKSFVSGRTGSSSSAGEKEPEKQQVSVKEQDIINEEDLKKLQIEDENIKNTNLVHDNSDFNDTVDKKLSEIYKDVTEVSSVINKNSIIDLENNKEFETVLKEFYELK